MVLRDSLSSERQDLANVQDDDDAWAADPPVAIDHVFPSPFSDGWLSEAPSAFDTRHDRTARLITTTRGVSPIIEQDFTFDDLTRSVPMGYTDLSVVEKRAVISDGRVVRLWPASFEPEGDVRDWTLFIPDDGQDPRRNSPVVVGTGTVLWHGLDLGCRLSRLMGGRPMVLARTLASHYWH